ncbi:choice-of-anchor L domain-containing protein, partial [Flavobacterium sp. RHBU_3]|uniref:choice-of-anchor L domain-containing protein n=1 Tax=Flavobacterium sp. RHBU_3 TaxID=3391184 RepID=UPI003985586A
MRKTLLSALLLLFTVIGMYAQPNVVVYSNNSTMSYDDGEVNTYVFTVTNTGTAAATNVVVSYPIPAGITAPPAAPFASVEVFTWSGNSATGTNVALNNTIANLAVNQTVTYTVNIYVPHNYANLLALPTVTYATYSDIEIVNTNNQTEYTPGSTVTYTVTVTNNGPQATTTGVLVSNAIPAGVTGFTWSNSNGQTGTTAIANNNTGILDVNETVTYTISFTVPATYTGNLVDTVTYTANVTDPVPGCTQCVDTDTSVNENIADIVIVNTDSATTYTPGGTAVYNVVVTNTGPGTAQYVSITEAVPAGITNMSWYGNNNAGTGALNNVIVSLANGETVTYTVEMQIPVTFTGNLTSTVAVASSTSTDPDTTCLGCTDIDAAPVVADLEITNTDGQDTFLPGNTLTYTLAVTNNGPSAATGVVVTYPAPAGTTITGWSNSAGTTGTGNIADALGGIAVGQTVTYTVTVAVPVGYTGSSVVAAAGVTSTTVDPTPTCTACADVDTLLTGADLVVTNTDGQTTFAPGDTLTYTLTVTNNGPDEATGVVVNYPAPAGTTITGWTNSAAATGTGDIADALGTIAVGQTVTYTITVAVPLTYTDLAVVANADVTSATTDPVPGCTACTDTDYGTVGADLVVTNTDGQDTFEPGDVLTYTLTLTNNGPQDATAVVVAYPSPAGTTITGWTSSEGATGTGAVADNLLTLTVGQTVTYTVTVQVPAGYTDTTVVATPSVTAATADPVPGCAACTDTDTLEYSQADVVTTVTDNTATYINGNTNTYTVTVTNNGPGTATNVQVAAAVPALVPYVSWTGSNGTSGTGALSDVIASLPNGSTVTYTVQLQAPDDYYGTITYQVNTSSDNDPDPSCTACSDTDTNQFNPADIDITLVDDNIEIYTQGGTSTYTVEVTNVGPSVATDFMVNVPLPAGATNFTWSATDGSSGTGAINENLGDVLPGTVVTYTIVANISASATGAITLAPQISTSSYDVEPGYTDGTDTDYGTSSADIVTTITIPNATYTAGTNAVYTVTVTNNGPDAAQNVAISNTVPTGFTAAQVTWTGNDTTGTGTLTDTIGLLLPGETVTYTYSIAVPSGYDQSASIVNAVAVTSTTPDPNPECTTCSALATPAPQADLITVKTDNQTTYVTEDAEFNGALTYYITITNAGPSDAYNVQVTDNKPYNIVQMTWSGNDTGGISNMSDTIDVIPAGESVTYEVTIIVPTGYNTTVGTLTNVVSVTSGTPDPNPACLQCTDVDTPAPKYVTVTKNQYTVQQLVEDVLIDTDCVTIQNITYSAGSVTGNFGIGYFEANNSTFPIQNGIVIRCGNALATAGPYSEANISTTGSGVTDANLQTVNNANGQTGPIQDASYIQFEFIPVSNHMSFDFLFASNEYGTFQCGYSDVFAFLLSDLTNTSLMTNNNIALIPGTSTPVSVTNIRNNLYNAGCGSVNASFFGVFNAQNATTQANAAISMRGQTVKMTAESDVIAGHTYKIKLAIGDYSDSLYDSAVFLEAGSFDIGQPELPTDLTFANAAALCYGETYDVIANVANENMLVKWQKDGQWIYNTDGSFYQEQTYTVTEAGTYTILGYLAGNPDCFITDDIIVNYYDPILSGDPVTLVTCGDPAGTAVFNLEDNLEALESGMIDPSLITLYYYDNLSDVQNNEPSLFGINNYQGTDNQIIYVVLEDYETGCRTMKQFTLDIMACDVPLSPIGPIVICEPAPYDSTETVDLTQFNDTLLNQISDTSLYTVSYHENQGDANSNSNPIGNPQTYTATNETVYIRVQNNEYTYVYNTQPLQIIINPQPALEPINDVSACDSYTLPPLTEGEYRNASGGAGDVIPVGTALTATQTVYVYEVTGTVPYTCTYEQSFVVNIYPTPDADNLPDVEVCDSYILPVLTVGSYYSGANGTGTQFAAGDSIDTTQLIYIYATSGDANVTCTDETSFTVTVNYAPVLAAVTPLEACDDVTNNGVEIFNLTPAGAQAVNGSTAYTLTYYTTLAAAQVGGVGGQITDPTAYEGSGTVYVRVKETATTTDCYSVAAIQLIVHPKPDVLPVSDYILCDDTAPALDGIETFDLTTKNTE